MTEPLSTTDKVSSTLLQSNLEVHLEYMPYNASFGILFYEKGYEDQDVPTILYSEQPFKGSLPIFPASDDCDCNACRGVGSSPEVEWVQLKEQTPSNEVEVLELHRNLPSNAVFGLEYVVQDKYGGSYPALLFSDKYYDGFKKLQRKTGYELSSEENNSHIMIWTKL